MGTWWVCVMTLHRQDPDVQSVDSTVHWRKSNGVDETSLPVAD